MRLLAAVRLSAELAMRSFRLLLALPGFRGQCGAWFQAISVVAVGYSLARVGEHRSHSKRAGVRSEDFV
jgi:hypothetical protein